jgi:glutamate-1-semialdehyde 2,1-aminomutase
VARGTPQKALEDVVVIPFNDPVKTRAILDRHRGEVACVLIDPMPHRVGLIPAKPEFMRMLREWTAANGALLVFDEVITFRSEYGGAQAWYDVKPDLTAMGKVIGGGFPVGALAGKAEVMSVMNPLASEVRFPHSGTFSANPVTMTAGLTTMQLFDQDAVAHTNALAARAKDGIEAAIADTGVAASVSGGGSMFRVHMKDHVPVNYRESIVTREEQQRLRVMLDHLFENGFIMINTCSYTTSTVMGDAEIDSFVEAMHDGFRKIA